MALDNISLGQRIRTARRRRGISQMDLAKLIFTSPPYISYIENGTKGISMETFVLIANALNVSADELLYDCLENTIKATNHKFASLVMDCSEYETRILMEILIAAKRALRENRMLY